MKVSEQCFIKMNEIFEKDKKYIANTYNRADVCFISGKGSRLISSEGKEYIDFGSGIAVSSLGVSNDKLAAAIESQAKKLSHVSNLYYTEPQIELAEKLCKKSGMEKVFFSNSGAEANECAIKCARKYSFDKYGKDRYEIISLKNSFHGRTMATITATGQDVFHQYFNPFLEGFKYASPTDFEELKGLVSEKTCAVMLELVQGEGGIYVLEKDYVNKLAKLCAEKDVLLIVDEVQTGNGRTGTFYAFEQFGIMPDIVTTAKGLAGGLPLGATLFGAKTADTLTFGTHASTFGGNPIVCAAANAVVDQIDDKLLKQVMEKSQKIIDEVKDLPKVKSVSGLGLMLGIETTVLASEIVIKCREKGLILLTAKTKIRLLPALNIPDKDLQDGLRILCEELK